MDEQSDPRYPLISVLMNCLNCAKYLKEAVDSVYAQTYHNWEIIFWDNASTDRSAEIARSYGSRLRYFRGEQTVDLGAARNLALEQARGEFIAFLDCDDLWMPQKLEKQLPLFDDPEVGLVFSDSIIFNMFGESLLRYGRKGKFYTGYCFSKLLTEYFLDIETVVIRRAALDGEEMWFDPNFNLSEDGDFFTRIGYGWKLAMVNEPLAKWRVHEAGWTWAKGYLAPDERTAMLERYKKTFPNFSERFAKEIHILEIQIIVDRAKHLCKSGNSRAARRCLSPYLFKDRRASYLYFLSFLPDRIVSHIIARFRKNILPH